MKVYIYALVDPFTYEIRYIGKSIRPKERLANQCNEKSNTHRSHWIQGILKRGKKPLQVILEELPDETNWQEVERKWIRYGREAEWPLVNGTDGGDGLYSFTPDVREKMAKTWRGRKHNPESIAKIGKASKGRKHSEESKAYMREIMTGREFTPEWKDRISQAVRKFTVSDIERVHEMLAEGYRVHEIANAFGVHRTTISKIKAGKYP